MQHPPDDLGRRSRFAQAFDPDLEVPSRQSRAASQPPRQSDIYSSSIDLASRRLESAPRNPSPSTATAATSSDWPPITRSSLSSSRSMSFSEQPVSTSVMAHLPREGRMFPSTFEDDEESVDEFDTYTYTSNRHPDDSGRSRPQSIASLPTRRPSVASSPLQTTSYGFGKGYGAPGVSSTPLNRYGLAPGRIDTSVGSPASNAYNHLGYRRVPDDHSNMSPFVRDVSQIVNDDNIGYRDLWGSTLVTREDGGGSGTTSRRHSVSVVQPRRGISVGFSVAGGEPASPKSAVSEIPEMGSMRDHRSIGGGGGFSSGRGLMFSDEELAGSLNMLNIHRENEPSGRSHRISGPSQPSSLPTYTPQRAVGSPVDPPSRLNLPGPSDFSSSFGSAQNRNSHGSYQSSRFDSYSDRDHSVSPAAERPLQLDNGLVNGYAQAGRNGNSISHQQQQLNDPFAVQRSGFQQGTFRAIDALKQPSQQFQFADQMQSTYDDASSRLTHNQGQGVPQNSRSGSIPPPLSFQSIGRSSNYLNTSMPSPLSPSAPNYGGTTMQSPPPTGNFTNNNFYMQQTPQRQNSLVSTESGQGGLNELGRGVPLYAVPSSAPLYIVEFKAGRTDIFYCADPNLRDLRKGDLVIVEADRGRDLGRVTNDSITPADVEAYQRQQAENAALQQSQGHSQDDGSSGAAAKSTTKELMPKRIYSKAQAHDTQLLASKTADELKALQLCQSKVRQKKLPMEVVDAEYQWDRRKLTFYFIADRRIDFRELVRELFRLYKTRIWMACLQGPTAE